jgi:hypothetical protein
MQHAWKRLRKAYTILEGKKPLGRTTYRWEDNIRMDLRRNKMGTCGLNSSGSG